MGPAVSAHTLVLNVGQHAGVHVQTVVLAGGDGVAGVSGVDLRGGRSVLALLVAVVLLELVLGDVSEGVDTLLVALGVVGVVLADSGEVLSEDGLALLVLGTAVAAAVLGDVAVEVVTLELVPLGGGHGDGGQETKNDQRTHIRVFNKVQK
eukprot:252753_1